MTPFQLWFYPAQITVAIMVVVLLITGVIP